MPLKFDEANKLQIQQSQNNFSYEEYFGVMDISDEEKSKRIELAKKLEKVFVIMFALYLSDMAEDEDYIFIEVYKAYIEEAKKFLQLKESSSYIEQHARKIIQNLIDVTQANLEDEENEDDEETDNDNGKKQNYFLSQKRAMLIAANEANSIANYGEYVKAVKEGKDRKTWKSEQDNKVRDTHRQVDGITIGIFEPFEVGGYLMMFPKDMSLGADINEIANCRCTAEYSYSKQEDEEDSEE